MGALKRSAEMKKSYATTIFAIVILIVMGVIAHREWRARFNPYKNDGLTIKWDVGGATSAYPWIDVSAIHNGEEIRPGLAFGGIEYPKLRFRDYNSDGRRDIIFTDGRLTQAVAFFPAVDERPPSFTVLRNDMTWP